jgi:hypothetical protein
MGSFYFPFRKRLQKSAEFYPDWNPRTTPFVEFSKACSFLGSTSAIPTFTCLQILLWAIEKFFAKPEWAGEVTGVSSKVLSTSFWSTLHIIAANNVRTKPRLSKMGWGRL